MYYCAKCRSVCPDTTARCPGCRSGKLRPAEPEDLVLLHRADQYTAGKLTALLEEAGVTWRAEPIKRGRASYLYDSEAMPTDQTLYVAYRDRERAMELSSQVRRELEAGQETPEPDTVPLHRRIVLEIVSTVAFLLLVMLAVFGADALANWLKGLFGAG